MSDADEGAVPTSPLATGRRADADVPQPTRAGRRAAEKMPRHIAIIMDGNGRWARQQGLPRIEGHRRGAASVRRVTEECARLGIEQLTLYCLSSENWKRPAEELDFLMQLLEHYMVDERPLIMEHNIRVSVIGRREGIAEDALREMDETVAMSAGNTGLRLCLAINYGGRAELVDACRRIAEEVRCGRLRPRRDQRGDDCRPSLHGRHARARPADPHGRRDAGEQLPAVADQLCRDLGDRALLARFRRGPAARRDSRFCLPRPAVWRAGEVDHVVFGKENCGKEYSFHPFSAGNRGSALMYQRKTWVSSRSLMALRILGGCCWAGADQSRAAR